MDQSENLKKETNMSAMDVDYDDSDRKRTSRGKDDDRLSFSLSEDEADDTADSLDIKPPQATVLHRKNSRHKKDKYSLERRVHGHSRDGSSHRKSHHHSEERRREHKDKDGERTHRDKDSVHYREKERREKRLSHRERHEQRERYERSREGHSNRDRGGGEESKYHDRTKSQDTSYEEQSRAEQLLQDLRGKLLDKRNIREGKTHSEEPERKKMKKDKKSKDEKRMKIPDDETPKEKAERIEKEERRAKLLEAEREMALRKEVSRRELEARRERINLEKENQKMLKEIAKKHKLQEKKEKEDTEGDVHGDDDNSRHSGDNIDVDDDVEEDEDDDEEDSDESSDLSPTTHGRSNEDDLTEDERGVEERTPESLPPLEKSPQLRSDDEDVVGMEEEAVGDDEEDEKDRVSTDDKHDTQAKHEDVDKVEVVRESPKSDIVLKENVLPPYLPAVQGCRSVEEFQCLNRIEEGTYGVVFRARDKRTEDIVALKRLKMEKEKEGFPITSLREINTLLKAQHPNIVTVREIVVGSNMDKIFIVMDYVEHDLKSLMETMKSKKQVFLPGEVKCLMQQLLRAVAHLHDNWILHRDLKTSNLLLSHKGVLKVGDFGLAREYGSPLKPYTPIVVTLWYRAPELLLQAKEYSTAIDMWSVGCIFGELLQMEALFCGRSDMDQLNRIFKELGTPNERVWPGYSKLPATQKVTFAEHPVNQLKHRFSSRLTELGVDMMNKFLMYDPVQRVTAEEALKHLYFKEAPLPIDPAMFPTWPAKSELGHKKVKSSPKPPSGGKQYKQLGDTDDDVSAGGGFHMGMAERRTNVIGPGFSLKF